MNRLGRIPKWTPEKIIKETPNWNIQSLYNDRQLIRNKKLTKYFIPFDSSDPDGSWTIFVFGQNNSEKSIELTSPTTLIGRESFCDVILNDLSVSRQHCVIQFRKVLSNDENNPETLIKPYIFDISSKGGTFINKKRIPASCFIELKHKDILSFAHSEESIVLMEIVVQKEFDLTD